MAMTHKYSYGVSVSQKCLIFINFDRNNYNFDIRINIVLPSKVRVKTRCQTKNSYSGANILYTDLVEFETISGTAKRI